MMPIVITRRHLPPHNADETTLLAHLPTVGDRSRGNAAISMPFGFDISIARFFTTPLDFYLFYHLSTGDDRNAWKYAIASKRLRAAEMSRALPLVPSRHA